MKKVLFTATVDSHIRQFHLPFLQWFKKQGFEVHVATNGDEKIQYCDKKFFVPFERNPIKLNNIKAIKELKTIIEKEKYDLIHCHTPMGSVVTRLAAIKSRKKNGTKVIYTAHGFHFFKGAPVLNWLVYYPVEKWLSKYTDCLVTINQEDYELATKKFKTKQIEFINGVGVNPDRFQKELPKEEKEQLLNSLGLSNEDFIIIYPAELSKRKNQGMLLRTVQSLKNEGYDNIKVLLPGIDSLNGKYQKMAKDLDIDKQILFLGYREDIPKLMKLSTIAVSTSIQEGLPVNIIEAKMSGLPVIATNCRGNRDLVDDDFIVKINDEKELEDKIKQTMENKLTTSFNIQKYSINEILNEMINKVYTKERFK